MLGYYNIKPKGWGNHEASYRTCDSIIKSIILYYITAKISGSNLGCLITKLPLRVSTCHAVMVWYPTYSFHNPIDYNYTINMPDIEYQTGVVARTTCSMRVFKIALTAYRLYTCIIIN